MQTQSVSAPQFTAEQVRVLAEFADDVAAGRRVLRLISWIGAIALAITALAYYVVAIRNGLRTAP